MENKTIVKVAAIGFIGVVLVPIAINVGAKLVAYSATGIAKVVGNIKFKKKIKEGLKDGSIVEIDGKYYEVDNVEEA